MRTLNVFHTFSGRIIPMLEKDGERDIRALFFLHEIDVEKFVAGLRCCILPGHFLIFARSNKLQIFHINPNAMKNIWCGALAAQINIFDIRTHLGE